MTVAGRSDGEAAAEPRPPLVWFVTTAAWAAASVVLVLVAASAMWRSGEMVTALIADFPRPYGRLGLGVIGAYALGTLAVVLFARRAAVRNAVPGLGLPLLIVSIAILVRLALAVVADAQFSGENRILHQQAVGVLDGVCCIGHRPMGYPIALAGVYAVLGVGPSSVEALNILFAGVTAFLVWEIGRATWGRPVAAVAATAYAVMPSQVLIALVPLTEPMYTMMVAGAVRAGIALERRPMLVAAAAVAALLAVAQYVRASAASLMVPFALLPWLMGWTISRTLLRAVFFGVVFVIILLPVVAFNLRGYGDVSVSTSAYGGWSLYVGANRDSDGQWSSADAVRLAGFPGDSWWERSEYAGSLAIDRVLEDPAGSVGLLPRKFHVLWGDEGYAAEYALAGGPASWQVSVGWLASQLFWAPVVVLAALGMFVSRRDQRPATLLIGMTITLVAVTHLALEVHSRYHAYLLPLFCLLAAAGAEAVGRRWRARRPLPAAP